jgi:hypothetical protein
MPTEMKDDKKGGEERINKAKQERQEEIDKKDIDQPEDYPKPAGKTDKDVPEGT